MFLTVMLILLFSLSFLTVTALMIKTSFLETEMDLAEADLARVISALSHESESLGKTVFDYALWDDTWEFANGGYPGYWEDNFNGQTVDNLGLALIVVLDDTGTLIKAQCFDSPSKTLLDAAREIPYSGLGESGKAGAGFVTVCSMPVMFRSADILRSDGSGPPAGTLLMGVALDPGFMDRIAERTNVVASRCFSDMPPSLTRVRSAQGMTAGLDGKTGSGVIHGYVRYGNPFGAAVFTACTETPRALVEQETKNLRGTLLVYLAIALVFVFIVNGAYRYWFASPLLRLETEVDAFALENPRPLVGMEPLSQRQDEIGHIASAIRAMHSRVLSAHDEVRRLNVDLERLVKERTLELLDVNCELTIFKKILENTSEAVVITDLSGSILELNEAMCRMTGYARDEMIGMNSRIFKSGRHSNDFYRDMWRKLMDEGHWEGEIWDRRKDGSVYPKWQTINVVHGESGQPVNYIGVSTDITVIKEAEEKLNHLAYYDPLTGLPNRMLFSDRVEHEVATSKRTDACFAVLYIDLDRFKHVNDSLGHVAGDTLLVQVADRIKGCLRDADTLCRIGGDEFAIVLQNLEREENAGMVAQKLVVRVSQRFEINGKDIYIGASVGIALYPKDGIDTESLIRKADGALFLAKEEGKGLYRYASGELERVNRSRLEIEGRLHRALERGEFVLHYQPQVLAEEATPGLHYGLCGVEALIRWQTEPGVLVPPGEFLAVAEDTGFIAPLGDWVLLQACRDAKRWEDAGHPVPVAVNVAPRQFDTGNFEKMVASVLATTGLTPSLLKLEVTESGFMRNIQRVTETMNRIKATGVTFAIDDFGTGYCSMNYLNRLPVDCLKVDQSFVRAMNDDHTGGDIVSAIISMAKAFGLASIAEGVETYDQLEALKGHGCEIIQGYLVSRPLSRDAFEEFIGMS